MTLEPGPLRDALVVVASHPLWPTGHLARLAGQPHDEFLARLQATASVTGWLREEPACCGRQSRFEITDAGRAVLADES